MTDKSWETAFLSYKVLLYIPEYAAYRDLTRELTMSFFDSPTK